ncbi:GNAT family N-acetyltransferase [Thiotrichales bacterium 19X7-9]|nr:GNAT family N-acetyltransferase [Thiotrichales bacterium 19X7-9]
MNQIVDQLRKLEESLWIAQKRFDYDYMDQILDENFFEYGRSGKIYSRSETISHQYQDISAKIPLENFQIHDINDHVKQVTYISEVGIEKLRANRSSIWINKNNQWKLIFHQGTPINNLAFLPKSPRCSFRLLSESHQDRQLLEYLDTNPINMEFFPNGAKSCDEIPKMIERFINNYKQYNTPIFMLFNQKNEFIGRAGFSYVSELNAIEVGYVIDHKHWKKGYATEALKTLLAWATYHFDCQEIFAFTGINHIGSIKVMEKSGMQYLSNRILKDIECVLYSYQIN